MSSSLKEEFRLSSFTLDYPDHSCFHRPQWSLPSWAYPVWRLFWCVWHVTWLIVSGVRTQNSAPDDEDGVKWFVYASNWTFMLTTFFCILDFILVMTDICRRSRERGNDHNEQHNGQDKEEVLFQGEFTLVEGIKTQSTPCSAKLQWCLFEMVNCSNLLTTIAFWASQYKDGDYIHADIAVFNIVNTVFVVANTMVTGLPVRILHFIYPTIFVAGYFFFNLIYFLADGKAISGSDVTFRPLDWNEAYPTAFTIIAGFLVFIPLGHLIFFSLFTLRIYLFDKLGGNSATEQAYSGGTYRKRNSSVNIEEDRNSARRVQDRGFVKSAHVNEGFEMESDTRR